MKDEIKSRDFIGVGGIKYGAVCFPHIWGQQFNYLNKFSESCVSPGHLLWSVINNIYKSPPNGGGKKK